MRRSCGYMVKLKSLCTPSSKLTTKAGQMPKMTPNEHLQLTKEKLSSLKTQFLFRKGEIDVIYSPSMFYQTLKDKILNAENKIFIASLYIGKTEDDLIHCIRKSLQKNPKLKVYFLIDGLRGTREAPFKCSASLLTNLLEGYEDRVDIRLYRTPAFVGLRGLIAPKRINEGLGLQHMKIYGFDDEVILSGANLSSDYFSNRQDRYYLFQSKEFSNYYFKLHQIISSLSYKVDRAQNPQNFLLKWPSGNPTVDPARNRRLFLEQASKTLNHFLHETHDFSTGRRGQEEFNCWEEYPTVVYPVSQFTPLFPKGHDRSTEKTSILNLISSISTRSLNWTFTAGYFNMLPEIKKSLISSEAKGTVITASPFANGFFQSSGISGHLPAAYLHLSKTFLETVKLYGKESLISLREWTRGIVNKPGGWSYHAKGIWISNCEGDLCLPFTTCIGSSNYTKRAYSLDLESNAIILTNDLDLRRKMKKEIENILQYTQPVTLEDFKKDPERHVSTGVKVATTILGKRL